jgi:peptidoglycan/LPS O-acetylase OafA/YrhL
MRTFGTVLESAKGTGPGFDFMRIALALSIVLLHAFTVTNQYYPADDTPLWLVHYALVPMFFAISGFLVTASAMRLSTRNFLISRALRILPALSVNTLVCALVIGPLFTLLSFRAYFASPVLHSYFLNMVGWVHFYLPGVFETHPFTRVNGSLWTVPFEMGLYALVSLLMFTGVIFNKHFVLSGAILYVAVSVVVQGFGVVAQIPDERIAKVISAAFIEYEAQAVSAFLVGMVAYQFRNSIPYDRRLFFAFVAAAAAIAFSMPEKTGELPAMRLILIPAIVYVTIFGGLTKLPLPKFFRSGDYSYSVYLFHQPFLQIFVALAPALALAPHFGATLTYFASLPAILATAYLSFHLVEKPTLALRKKLPKRARQGDSLRHPDYPPRVQGQTSLQARNQGGEAQQTASTAASI